MQLDASELTVGAPSANSGVQSFMSSPVKQAEHARIPSLDGLRAISIGLVMFGHLNGTRGFPLSRSVSEEIVDWGSIGVRVFFVISGFLITRLLIDEQEKTGTISLRRFYFRRTLRIFPAYYVFILCMALAASFGLLVLRPGDILAALTYTMNYHWSHAWNLGHTWSLSVEEQFYLLWPAALVLAGLRRGLKIAFLFVLAAPFIRIGLLAMPGAASGMGFRFETVGDALAIGCLLAGLRDSIWQNRLYRSFLESRWFVLAPVLIFVVSVLPTLEANRSFGFDVVYEATYNFVGITLINVLIAMCIDWTIRNSKSGIGHLLNWRPLAFIGTLSYSLYLWQEPFIHRTGTATWTSFPLNILLAFVFATASFYLIEQPALRFRQSIERRRRATRKYAEFA